MKETPLAESSAHPVRIVALVGDGSVSPLKCATWVEVMLHTVSNIYIYPYIFRVAERLVFGG